MSFKIPLNSLNKDRKLRKAGFELEFTGIEQQKIAEIVKQLFQGEIKEKSRFEYSVENTEFGEFKIEIDADILLNKGYEKYFSKAGIDLTNFEFRPSLEDILNKIASTLVPFEIVTPPVPFDRLDIIDKLSDTLYAHGAKGTKESLLNAFGMHINSEVPSFEPEVLISYLKSFFLLFEYIYKESKIDFTRKLTPFIDNFPDEYINLVINKNYNPDRSEMINDYLLYNPTRNRPLDMLPVFAFIDENKIKKTAEDFHLIGKRPAFHYRLPNCSIASRGWKPSDEWNLWYEIERLASDKKKTDLMSEAYINIRRSSIFWKNEWIEKVKDFING